MVKFSKRSNSRKDIIKVDDESLDLSILTKQFKPLLTEKKFIAFITITLLLLIVGIVLIVIAKTRSIQCQTTATVNKIKKFDACAYSEEAKRIKLGDFLFKVREEYHVVFPEEIAWHPNATDEMVRQYFKILDPRPENIKLVTDRAIALLNEAKDLVGYFYENFSATH